jgi:anthranilate/para-aminobenzoate synthase component I
MITDLVRNDLSQTAQKRMVQVPELCAVYSFMQEMISTVTSLLDPTILTIGHQKIISYGKHDGAPRFQR